MTPEEKEHIWQEYMAILPAVIEAQGIANVVAGLSDAVEQMWYDELEFTSREDDLFMAVKALDEAVHKCDLEYK